MKLSNKTYDILKWIVMIVLPAAGTLYTGLSSVWGWPMAEQVSMTFGAVNTFLGVILGVSSAQYQKVR